MVIELIVWKGQGRVRGSHRISARGGKLTKIQEIGTKTPRAKRVSIANEAHKKKFPPPPEQFSPPPLPYFFLLNGNICTIHTIYILNKQEMQV